jgi:hypothetical protein
MMKNYNAWVASKLGIVTTLSPAMNRHTSSGSTEQRNGVAEIGGTARSRKTNNNIQKGEDLTRASQSGEIYTSTNYILFEGGFFCQV